MRHAAALLLLCAASFACRLPGSGPERESSLSLEEERALTEDIARQIRGGAPLVDDPVLLAYLDEIGQSLVSATQPQPFLYRFSIIDDPALNAFTIGGGHIYVHSGVIAQVGDVSELAGVLAHEIAHVRERHIARRQEGQGLATLLTVAAAAAVVAAGADPELVMVAQSLNVALQLKNSRSAETQADYEGIQYLVRAGYAPRGMGRFFQRILLESPRSSTDAPSYLFTHPAVEERISATQGQIARMDLPAGLRTEDTRLARMQERLTLLQSRVAGGSGLLARAEFDRSVTEPALAQAETLREQGDPEAADDALARAQERESGDPRVALARGRLAEERGDLRRALEHIEQAYQIDPGVALARYELGRFHALLGDRRKALFHFDQAAMAARPGSRLFNTVEREIDLTVFPPFERAELRGMDPRTGTALPGDAVVVEITLPERLRGLEQPIRIHWLDPDGVAVLEEKKPVASDGAVRSSYSLPKSAAAGTWSVELRMGESQRREIRFQVTGS